MKKIMAILLCTSLLFCMSACGKKDAPTPEKMLGKGEEYLDDRDYDQALEQFLAYIELEPKDAYGYICAADAYIGMDKDDKATDILEKGFDKTDSNRINEKLNALRVSAEPSPAIPEPEEQPTEPEPADTTILTVSAVNFADMGQIGSIEFINERDSPVFLNADWNKWFQNATVNGVTLTGEISMALNKSGGYDYALMDGSKMCFDFVVDGESYPIGVCEGAQFAVKKTSDGYVLLPEETAAMSPPPVDEGMTDEDTGNSAFDEYFEYGGWHDTHITLTARKEASVTGISVLIGGEEYKSNLISNTSGELGLERGVVATQGSSLSLFLSSVIIFEGTTVNCDIHGIYDEPEQICVYLESGEELTKDL